MRHIIVVGVLYLTTFIAAQAQDAITALKALQDKARAEMPITTMQNINDELRPHDIIYMPDGVGPFPVVLFFHGCSGRTLSHEQDWAARLNSKGAAVISVDSYSGRDIKWEDACNMQTMLPWQRASDIASTVNYVKTLEKINGEEIYLAGFSHGAITIWSTLVYASDETAPVGLENWPDGGIEGVKGAFMFYGSCLEPWTVDVDATMFLGDADIYIDEKICQAYQPLHPNEAGNLTIELYIGATHTFDHSKPNASNVEAGSRYDPIATNKSWKTIQKVMGLRD
ncbi:MAG: dienelactone hydrolase family protein [Emcibacteraceae bacterium]|nr:dienelactone hydrolase family protein [Emcibacteraceae bacterium]